MICEENEHIDITILYESVGNAAPTNQLLINGAKYWFREVSALLGDKRH